MKYAPGGLRAALRTSSSMIGANYQILKKAIKDYLQSGVEFDGRGLGTEAAKRADAGRPAPVDVGGPYSVRIPVAVCPPTRRVKLPQLALVICESKMTPVAMRENEAPSSPSKEKSRPRPSSHEPLPIVRLRGEKEGRRLGYRERIAEEPLVPRHVHLYRDLTARREHLQDLQQRNAEEEAREVLARMPRLTEEEKEELNRHRSQWQAPVWFMRDEDIRVKAALQELRRRQEAFAQLDAAKESANIDQFVEALDG
eukprot:s135_g11.t1